MNGPIRATARFLDEQRLAGARLLAAVSGGVDSTALLVALHELGVDVVAAHVNHRLRGEASDADERFVRDLCATLGIELHVADGALPPELVRTVGIEAAAREVRYARLHELRARCGAASIATAHQQNDQAETVLMGRRIHGVRADGVIRPLLEVPRRALDELLRERGIVPRVDATNADTRFVRNRIRASLREEDVASLAAAARVHDVADDADCSAGATRFRSWPADPAARAALLARHVRRLEPHARPNVRRIAAAIERAPRVSVTKRLELVRDDGGIVLRVVEPRQPIGELEAPLAPERPARLGDATVHLRRVDDAQLGNRDRQRIELPADAAPDFLVRNRRRGDRFQPLGLASDKKLKDFFIDRKIAAELRDRIPLILWNGAVVSVAGVEVSERFKITAAGGQRYEVWVEHEHHSGVHG